MHINPPLFLLQQVTHALFGLNGVVQPQFLQLFAQAGDVYRQRVLVDEGVALPQAGHERLAADQAAAVLEQGGQDAIFVFGELDGSVTAGDDAVAGIEQHPAVAYEIGLTGIVVGAAQQRLYLGHEHRQIERLGDKVVAAGADGHDDVHVLAG